jgi:hypothetical protein
VAHNVAGVLDRESMAQILDELGGTLLRELAGQTPTPYQPT